MRAVAFTILQSWNSKSVDLSDVVTNKVGKSGDIPFSPLEVSADVRAEAACPDDAEINLAIWAPEGETSAQAGARVLLRRLAVKWWASYHTGKLGLKQISRECEIVWNVCRPADIISGLGDLVFCFIECRRTKIM